MEKHLTLVAAFHIGFSALGFSDYYWICPGFFCNRDRWQYRLAQTLVLGSHLDSCLFSYLSH